MIDTLKQIETSLKHQRLTPTLVLVSIVLLAVWMGAAYGGFFTSQWAPAALVLAALALIASLTGILRGAGSQGGNLALGLFAAYTAWTFASLLWSPNQGDAWVGAGQTLLYLLAFWLAVALVSLGASRRWVLAASALGPALVAALTWLALTTPRIEELLDFERGNGRLIGTVGNYHGEAAFFLVPFWVAIYLAGSRSVNPILRGLILGGATLGVEVAVLTQARGAVVAIAVSLAVFFLISGQRLRGVFALVPVGVALLFTFPGLDEVYLASSNGEPAPAAIRAILPTVVLTTLGVGLYGALWGLIDRRWRPPGSATRIAGGIALAASLGVLVFGAAVTSERVGDPVSWAEQKWEAFEGNNSAEYEESLQEVQARQEDRSRYSLYTSSGGRYPLWQVAWEDFASHPLLGVGTYNYEATYYQLRERLAAYVRGPHSLPLEVLSERGIVGGVLFFGFLATCLGAGLWNRFRHLGPEGKGQVGALTAAVTYWFAHSSIDWFWQLPAVTVPTVIYLAMLVGPWQRVEAAPTRWSLRAAGAGVALLAVAAVAPLYVADRYLWQSYAEADSGEALAAVKRAQRFNPADPTLFLREAEVAMQLDEWQRAEDAYRNAIQRSPEHYWPYEKLAEFYEQRDDPAAAFSLYREALALNPLEPDLNQDVMVLWAEVGGQESLPVCFVSETATELGQLNLTAVNSTPESAPRLPGSATLPPDGGVLFVWPADNTDPLWLEDTTVPLDVAFAGAEPGRVPAEPGRVTEIKSMTEPNAQPVRPGAPYRMAIVANRGFFESISLRPRSQVVVASPLAPLECT